MIIKDKKEWDDLVVEMFASDAPKVGGFDTETSGLNIIKDKPFRVDFGWIVPHTGEIRVFNIFKPELVKEMLKLATQLRFFVGHNIKFDLHMLENIGCPYPFDKVDNETHSLSDTMVMARLTTPCDAFGQEALIGLKPLAKRVLGVSEASEDATKISDEIKSLNKQRSKLLNAMLKPFGWTHAKIKQHLKDSFKDYETLPEEVREVYEAWNEEYGEANYSDVDESLMNRYAENDVIWTLELFKKLLGVIKASDQVQPWLRENRCIIPYYVQERHGFRVDIDYLKQSQTRVRDYLGEVLGSINDTWLKHKPKLLLDLSMPDNDVFGISTDTTSPSSKLIKDTTNLGSGQHKVILSLFASAWGIKLPQADNRYLTKVKDSKKVPTEASEFASLLIEARSLEKWLSTYINGYIAKYNSFGNGRVYTTINQAGTVSGRITSDFQQFPKNALKDRDGNELFAPRKIVINDDGYRYFYIDESQHELRIMANWTHHIGHPAVNLSRAFIPYQTDESQWEPTDLHSLTALSAFGEDAMERPDWKKLRGFGKMTNFASLYGAGLKTLQSGVLSDNTDQETIEKLYYGYHNAHPELKEFNKWVEDNVQIKGYVVNFYGRRYTVEDPRWAYKVSNYLVQGSAADMLKEALWPIYKLLEGYESKLVFNIHDEIIFSIKKGEEFLVPILREMLEPKEDWMVIPMVADVEITNSTWADKEDYEEDTFDVSKLF